MTDSEEFSWEEYQEEYDRWVRKTMTPEYQGWMNSTQEPVYYSWTDEHDTEWRYDTNHPPEVQDFEWRNQTTALGHLRSELLPKDEDWDECSWDATTELTIHQLEAPLLDQLLNHIN